MWISSLSEKQTFTILLSSMNLLNQTIRHLIIKTGWTLKALFVCPVLTFVGSNGVMYMCGEEKEGGCGKECGCEGKECECEK